MNLNMEGTKHEKALLVILSYVVGFTAGFLTFGLGQTPFINQEEMVDSNYISEIDQTMPVMDSEEPEMMSDDSNVSDSEANSVDEVTYEDGRLMANVNGATVLLSAQMDTLDPKSAAEFANQGAHTNIPKYSVSLDGNFIYYCEQHSDSDSCVSFVYDVDGGTIHYVTTNGSKLNTSISEAMSADWTEKGLTISGMTSVSADAPWSVQTAQ